MSRAAHPLLPLCRSSVALYVPLLPPIATPSLPFAALAATLPLLGGNWHRLLDGIYSTRAGHGDAGATSTESYQPIFVSPRELLWSGGIDRYTIRAPLTFQTFFPKDLISRISHDSVASECRRQQEQSQTVSDGLKLFRRHGLSYAGRSRPAPLPTEAARNKSNQRNRISCGGRPRARPNEFVWWDIPSCGTGGGVRRSVRFECCAV